MNQNPYESPANEGLSLPPRRLSKSARTSRIGVMLFLIGAPVLYWSVTIPVPPGPPLWFQVTVLLSALLVLSGLTVALVAGSIWFAFWISRKRRERLNVQESELHI